MYEYYIKFSDARFAIMDYIGEQTVSKYATPGECKAARSGAEGAIYAMEDIPPADVAPRAEVANKICCEIEEEIVSALESNYRAIAEHQEKHGDNVNLNFLTACYAKNNALRGMEAFVEELKNKYAEEQK